MGDTTAGLVCGHHHLYSALARGMPAPPETPTDFLAILEQIWWRLDVALDLEMIRWSAMLGALEPRAGATTIQRDDKQRTVQVNAYLAGGSLTEAARRTRVAS